MNTSRCGTIRTLVAVYSATALACAAQAQAQVFPCAGRPGGANVRLVVVASDLRSALGEVAFTIYPDNKSRFLAKGGKLLRVRVPADRPETRACFWLPPGHYALAQYHDENGDRDFNRTLLLPKEGFGFSNDAPTSIGLPSYEKARFALPAYGAVIHARMRYRR